MDTAKARPSPALLVPALALVLLVGWALAIGARPGAFSCPAEGAFSCAALVRPALRALGPLPLAPVLALGALAQGGGAVLLVLRGPRLPFARDVAILAALGAGFALGLQPLALLVAGRACLVCLLVLASELALALLLARTAARAGAGPRPRRAAFLGALLATGAVSTGEGLRQGRRDADARAALARAERAEGRVVLVERTGCPYCEALLLDVLARPEVLARLARTGLARRPAERGEAAPVLVARDRDGKERAREEGFRPDPALYEHVLTAAER